MKISTEIFCSEIYHADDIPYLNILCIRRRKIIFSHFKFFDQNLSRTYIDDSIKNNWKEYSANILDIDNEIIEKSRTNLRNILIDFRSRKNVRNFAKFVRSPNVMIDMSDLLSLEGLPILKKSTFDSLFLADILKFQKKYEFVHFGKQFLNKNFD